MTRGGDTAEIYLSCEWYADPNYITWNGIFHSTDNGQTISLQRKTNFLIESGKIFGDSTTGVLYQIPIVGQDTFGVSFDYGVTFEKKYINDIYLETAGCMAGEVYISSWGLYRGTDYGNNFTWQSAFDSLQLQEVGTLPGELYWVKQNGYNPLKLAYSNDYGQTFSIIPVYFPQVPSMFDYCDIHRGTEPGELYFVVWLYYAEIALYHSFDYGHTVTLQSYMFQTWDEIFYTAGRTPGSFYYARREVCGTPPCLHSCVWIYFSRDYGVTFTTYFHNLDSTLTGVSQKEFRPELKVFPNPASDKLIFRSGADSQDEACEIQLYDLMGKSVYQGILRKNQTEVSLDIRTITPGIYFYEIIQRNHRQTGKVVILR